MITVVEHSITDPKIEGLNPPKSRWRRRKGYFSDPAAVAQLYSNQLVILRLRVQSIEISLECAHQQKCFHI